MGGGCSSCPVQATILTGESMSTGVAQSVSDWRYDAALRDPPIIKRSRGGELEMGVQQTDFEGSASQLEVFILLP